jgi:hypothetical protein
MTSWRGSGRGDAASSQGRAAQAEHGVTHRWLTQAPTFTQEESNMQSDGPLSPGTDDQWYAEPAGEPSAEAIFALRVAAKVARELHELGREVRFALAPAPARVEVLLCDVDGIVLSRMTPSRVLEIATGAPLAGKPR